MGSIRVRSLILQSFLSKMKGLGLPLDFMLLNRWRTSLFLTAQVFMVPPGLLTPQSLFIRL